MSAKHPIVVVTGSSGAGTSSVTRTFQHIFRREAISAAIVEGDSFHRYDREQMKAATAAADKDGNHHFCHFSPEANLLEEARGPVPRVRRERPRQGPQVPARPAGGQALRAAARDVHAVG